MVWAVLGAMQVAVWEVTGAAAHRTVAPSEKATVPPGTMADPPMTVMEAV